MDIIGNSRWSLQLAATHFLTWDMMVDCANISCFDAQDLGVSVTVLNIVLAYLREYLTRSCINT